MPDFTEHDTLSMYVYAEGYCAYGKRKPNPHTDAVLRAAWDAGWYAAEDEYLDS